MAACLLIHGFGGSDFEMRPLVPALENAGYTVNTMLLPGHGSSVAHFRTTFFPDWLGHAKKQYRELERQHDQVAVIGASMGGILALALAAEFPVAAVVSLAAPAFIYRVVPWQVKDIRLFFLPLLAQFFPVLAIRSHSEESRRIAPWRGYEGVMCLPQLLSLRQGVDAVARNLRKVESPLLLIHDKGDRLVHPDCAWEIAKKVASRDITVRMTSIQETVTSHHVLTTHCETRDFVARESCIFLQRILKAV